MCCHALGLGLFHSGSIKPLKWGTLRLWTPSGSKNTSRQSWTIEKTSILVLKRTFFSIVQIWRLVFLEPLGVQRRNTFTFRHAHLSEKCSSFIQVGVAALFCSPLNPTVLGLYEPSKLNDQKNVCFSTKMDVFFNCSTLMARTAQRSCSIEKCINVDWSHNMWLLGAKEAKG